MSLAQVLAGIPYVLWHGVEVVTDQDDDVTVRLPFRPELANYVGIFHAGALYTLAETVAGVVADWTVPGERAFVLLRDAQIRYTRRAEGDVVAVARAEKDTAAAARSAFDESARADIAVAVAMTDAGGETVFTGTFNYALRPRQA